jgi:hypothetical protein
MTNPTLPNSRRALARACSAVSISQSCRCRNALFQFAYAEIESRKHPELSYRSCLGLLSLAKRYSPQRLEAACQRALALGALRQGSVRSILEHGLDSQPLPETQAEAAATPLVHENVRGAAYYQ